MPSAQIIWVTCPTCGPTSSSTATAQHQSLFWCHPDPDALWTLVGGCRMWERRVSDSDFCQVRIGLGTLPLATRLVPPTMEAISRLDPIAVTALHRFLRTHSTVPNVPITLALRGRGSRERRRRHDIRACTVAREQFVNWLSCTARGWY